MAKKSIGTYHATITATAQPFINELKRADNESRRATSSIRASISKTMRDVQREFSLPKLAKGVFAGFGIGGGMQLVDLGITKVIEGFQAGAKHAEEMSDAIDKMRTSLASLREKSFENILDSLAPVDRPEKISKELAYNAQLMQGAEAAKARAELDMQMAREGLSAGRQYNPFTQSMTEDPFGGRFAAGTSSNKILADAAEQQAKASKKIDSIRERIGELTKKHAAAVKEFSAEFLKTEKERYEADLDRLNLRNLGRTPGLAGDEDEINNRDRLIEESVRERMQAGQDEFSRWASASAMRVDDMTRRGLGTGADYASVGEKTNSILSDILETTKQAIAKLRGPEPRYTD